MCSTSKVNAALQSELKGPSSVHSSAEVPSIAAHKVQAHRSEYYILDVREADEIQETPAPSSDKAVPLGALLHDANANFWKTYTESKTVVVVCQTGVRAQLAAQSLMQHQPSTNITVLQNGWVGWQNPAALQPDFVVVLGGGHSTEKLSLCLAAAANAVDQYETVALVLLSDAVNWFVKPSSANSKTTKDASTVEQAFQGEFVQPDSDTKFAQQPTHQVNVEEVFQGEPFKPCKAMLNKFLTKGGAVLACTTCYKHRGYELNKDLMDCVQALQMPDLVRMMGEAQGNLQFT